ncbi:MAG: hypothetical protein Q9204_007375, partial [Flavoplaca sp. TL-2023a]
MARSRTCANADDKSPHDHAKDPNVAAEEHDLTALPVVEGETSKSPDEIEYPRMITFCILTIALMLSVFMIGLDTNIIGTAIPTMTARFHSLNDVGWYGSAYLMTQLALQPTFGKLYTLFNIKFIYIGALVIFELGSTICAAAPSSVIFILGRAISGAGSAGIWSGSFTIGTYLVPLRRKPLYISIVTSMYGVAAVAGPLLGGVFTDSEKLTWRFCFWWGGIVYAWKDARIWGCLIGFGGLILVFAALQLRRDHDCIFVALVNMAIDTHIYYLPFYFQAVQNTSAQGSGTRLLPYLISVFTTALATGILITTFGYYVPLMWLGAALLTTGCGLIQTLHVGSPTVHWFGYQVLTGMGFGMAFQIPYTAAQVVLAAEDLPMGNALVVFFQALGGALAISIGQNVLSSSLHSQLAQIPQVDPKRVINDGATRIVSSVVPELRDAVRAAYSVALSRTYILPIAAGGLAFLYLTRPGGSALSEFRRQALISDSKLGIEDIQGMYMHFVALYDICGQAALSDAQQDQLYQILGPATAFDAKYEGDNVHTIFVTPRQGTISPWSSKATSIAEVCGLSQVVKRIERGTVFKIKTSRSIRLKRERLSKLLYDPMTQALNDELPSLELMFAEGTPAPLKTVENSLASLQNANKELGLALDDSEIDYLINAYAAG